MQTSSPTPSTQKEEEKQEGMNFLDALKVIQMGKKGHSLSWEDKEFYIQIHDTRLQLHKPDGKWYDFIISENDLNAEDYIQIF